jgi:Flp pilus assembly pilin Flp
MTQLMFRLWADDSGALIATEWAFVATVLVLSLVVGLKAVESAVEGELIDFANAVSSLNQSYSFGGSSGCCGSSAGSVSFKFTRVEFSYMGCVPSPTLNATSCP